MAARNPPAKRGGAGGGRGKVGRMPSVQNLGVGAMGRSRSLKSLEASFSGDVSDEAGFAPHHAAVEKPVLTAEELDAQQERVLRARNPKAPVNVVVFNITKSCFTEVPTVDHMQEHYHQETKLYEKTSDEAKRQEQMHELTADADHAELHLRNEFNFSERATQTINNSSRDRETNTEPPPRTDFKGLTTQWDIFDTFTAELERQRAEKERSKVRGSAADDEAAKRKGLEHSHESHLNSPSVLLALRTMERMVSLNSHRDIVADYKYLEYPLDKLPEYALSGTLMPLWEFTPPKLKKRHVTCLAWNAEYTDLFAVGLGSYDFTNQQSGGICCFSLKSPLYPDTMYATESGVMCVHWHAPPHSSLLAVGCYDGTVLVFDVKLEAKTPLFRSSVRTGKHTDPVWQVIWQADDLAKKHNFYSVSSDGRVKAWTMVKSELQYTDVITLTIPTDSARAAASADPLVEPELFGLAGGLCFDFNTFFEHLFVVGTEEGRIHKCSKAYNAQYLDTYEGHTMAVYAVQWNRFHPRMFISCSADWTVKVWDHAIRHPLLSFDLNNSVADVAWAPYSSTVFAACTADGKVFVYDLAVNKHEPLCEQKVGKSLRLTHLAFNADPTNYTLIVGDSKGIVRSFRLSPNLRRIVQAETVSPQSLLAAADAPLDMDGETKPKVPPKSREQLEVEKFEAVLSTQSKSVTVIA